MLHFPEAADFADFRPNSRRGCFLKGRESNQSNSRADEINADRVATEHHALLKARIPENGPIGPSDPGN